MMIPDFVVMDAANSFEISTVQRKGEKAQNASLCYEVP